MSAFRFRFALWLTACAPLALGCASSTELTDDERYEIYMTNATRYYDAKRYPEAEQQVRKALAVDPDSGEAKLVLGWALLYQASPSKVDAAEVHFAECAAADGSDYRYFLGLGFSLFASGKMRMDRAESLAAENPTRETAGEDLARASSEVRREAEARLDRAISALERSLALQPDYSPAIACLGQARMLLGRYDEAIAAFDRYLPIAERARTNWEYFSKSGPTELDRKLAFDKIAPNTAKEVEVRIAVANIHYKKGRYAEAIEQLDKVLALSPKNDEALFNRGQCRFAQKEYDLARGDLRRFLELTSRPFDEMVRRSYDLLGEIETRAPMAAQSVTPAGAENVSPK